MDKRIPTLIVLIFILGGILAFKIYGNDDIIINKNKKTYVSSYEQTTPYLPGENFMYVEGTDLDTGLVMQDSYDNKYVWIEVPRTSTIYKKSGLDITSFTDSECESIYSDLKNYVKDYQEDFKGFADKYCSSESGISSENEYNKLKNNMVKSIYINGGFWIGQYEVGSNSYTTSGDNAKREPEIKENLYPYNYISCKKAQELASNFDSGDKTSSLMFGVQWDLILKFIETKGEKEKNQIKVDSTEWGNYGNSEFDITTGEYTESSDKKYEKVVDSYQKSGKVLCSTGITSRNNILNIYDLAGNVWEWTLEQNGLYNRCIARGGGYSKNGDDSAANSRASNESISDEFGFRVTIF